EDTSDGGSTTKGDNSSRTPSPNHGVTVPEGQPKLRHKKRLSNMSSSSGGSEDGTTWQEFDTSKLMSDRVAADIEHARETANEDE
ncbi:hypothetical protein, partial [Pseudoalteromonas sp. GW168-MNA-CIBAN-0100]|uniref:hypothetical protein n=1 Tax=Pseudoalteromonas sp. GW168-MNA-CIBAN-0100 TaxID=3140434 RepID=UPI0033284181